MRFLLFVLAFSELFMKQQKWSKITDKMTTFVISTQQQHKKQPFHEDSN